MYRILFTPSKTNIQKKIKLRKTIIVVSLICTIYFVIFDLMSIVHYSYVYLRRNRFLQTSISLVHLRMSV